jgi:hypothetical protein
MYIDIYIDFFVYMITGISLNKVLYLILTDCVYICIFFFFFSFENVGYLLRGVLVVFFVVASLNVPNPHKMAMNLRR